MSTTATPDCFTTLPDEARSTRPWSRWRSTVTLEQTGIADAINGDGGRWESARNKMFALDFATQAQQMKTIGGQPDYALAGRRPRAGRLRAAQPGREDP